jgi:signal transduction histidine kinase
MGSLASALDIVNLVLFSAVAVVALWQWRAGRGRAALWAALTFITLAVIIDVANAIPEDPTETFDKVVLRGLILGLVLFPYLLYRFTTAFEPPSRRIERLVFVITVAMLVWTVALPSIPGENDPTPGWFDAYLIAFVVHWTLLASVVAVRFWQARRGQPKVARRRMQFLSTGATAVTLALIIAAVGPDEDSVWDAVSAGFATLSAAAFLLGLAPPAALRLLWRRGETERLQGAIMRLMGATTEDEVASEVLGPMAAIVGARAVALRDEEERLVGTYGASKEMLARADREESGGTGEILQLAVPSGSLVVWTSPYAPYFGREELALLRTLGALTGLALDRARLFSEERESRAALERANDVMANFVALASHELRTPVAAISGLVETVVRRGAELDQGRRDQLEATLLSQSAHMRILVDQLLDLSRLDAEAVDLQPARVEMRTRLAHVVEAAAGERAGEVVLEVPEGLEVVIDPTALERIVSNLVTNALRYGETPITVRAENLDRHFRLAVEDSGPGVPAEFVPSLFERFTRSGSTRERATGTGLGLAIARSYAQAHGGDLLYETATPRGARFRLVIPLGNGPDTASPPSD